jgi:hypothetical protein
MGEGRALPEGTFLFPENHLLATENFGETERSVCLFTGYPEGANELTTSGGGTYLDSVFGEAIRRGIGFGQVYMGSNLKDFKKSWDYAAHALDKTRGSKNTVGFYSASNLTLVNPSMTSYEFERLVMISPFFGRESVGKNLSAALRFTLQLLNFWPGITIPHTDEFLDSIAPLMKNLQEGGKPVELYLGKDDVLLDSYQIEKLVVERFPWVHTEMEDRGHGIKPEKIVELFF